MITKRKCDTKQFIHHQTSFIASFSVGTIVFRTESKTGRRELVVNMRNCQWIFQTIYLQFYDQLSIAIGVENDEKALKINSLELDWSFINISIDNLQTRTSYCQTVSIFRSRIVSSDLFPRSWNSIMRETEELDYYSKLPKGFSI